MKDKPKKHTRTYYDYYECSGYLEEKYGYDERNYAKHNFSLADDDPNNPPYQDFWHFVIEKTDLYNGSFILMTDEWFDSAEEWQKEILEYYLSEFGEEHGGCREVEFYVWW